MTPRRALSVAVAGAALLLSSATCSDDPDPKPRPQPTTTAPSTTQSPTDADEQALRTLADDWYEANRALYREGGDPQVAAEFLTEDYLSGFIDQLEAFRATGNRGRVDPRSTHEVLRVEVRGDKAVISECVIDADVLLSPAGAVLNDKVVKKIYATSATRTSDGWKFNDRDTESEEEGVDSCAT